MGSRTKSSAKKAYPCEKYFDELGQDERIEDSEERFQVEIYNQLLNILVSRLGECFTSFSAVTKNLNVLSMYWTMLVTELF